MKRLLVIGLVALAALATALSASAAESPARVTEAAGSGFPSRSYVLTLPQGMTLGSGAVQVFENGQPVSGLTVTPVGRSSAEKFGVVLAIDSSISMRGEAIAGAMEAAQALAAQRQKNQLFGIITFNGSTNVVLPLTDDNVAIESALARTPALAPGTRIYDAVDEGVKMLKARHIAAGTIVVLSDGADVGSAITEATAAAHARDAHVRVYTVGLKSRFFKRAALQDLARDVGGTFILATDTRSLKKIYSQLGSKFASEYLLSYRSTAGPDKPITVTVRVAGLRGAATSGYRTPPLTVAKKGPAPPYKPSAFVRFWTSSATMSAVGLLAAGLLGLAALLMLSGPKKGTVRRRMAEFVSVPTAVRDSSRRPTAQLTDRVLEGTESMLRGSGWWQRFRWEMEIAKIAMPPEQIMVLTGVGSLLVFLFVNVVFGSLLIAIALAVAVPFGVRSLLKRQLSRQRRLFAQQLPDNLQVLASALRAGHSFIGALSVVVNDAPEPARSEFQRVVADEQLGVPIDDALRVVVERMESRELEQVALVGALQRETGGNTAEVLDRVTDTIRERFELQRAVQTLTAQGRMSRWVLTALPLFLLLAITLINPGYMEVMYGSTGGRVILVLSAISVTCGSLVIKRIVNIKV